MVYGTKGQEFEPLTARQKNTKSIDLVFLVKSDDGGINPLAWMKSRLRGAKSCFARLLADLISSKIKPKISSRSDFILDFSLTRDKKVFFGNLHKLFTYTKTDLIRCQVGF